MSSSSTVAVEITGLTCIYKGRTGPAVEEITVNFEMGTTVALVGPNGAGKSTLMKAIYGAIEPTSGAIKILGKPLSEHAESYKILGFTSDENLYSTKARVKDLFDFEVIAQGLSKSLTDEVQTRFDIARFWKSKLGKLSTGQRQRVLIALATLSNPAVLLLDEPANGLDIESLTWLYELIKRRENDGKLTVVSSHNLAELQQLASKVVVINQTLRHQGDFFPDAESFESLRAQYLELVKGGK